jgi:hypothetical protein
MVLFFLCLKAQLFPLGFQDVGLECRGRAGWSIRVMWWFDNERGPGLTAHASAVGTGFGVTIQLFRFFDRQGPVAAVCRGKSGGNPFLCGGWGHGPGKN